MALSPEAARRRIADARVYLVLTRKLCRLDPVAALRSALAGGVDVVQVREPGATGRELVAWARVVRQLTKDAGVPLIINDRPDVARIVGAEGVHVGQDDVGPRDIRSFLGPDAIVGLSTHDVAQVVAARKEPVDYVGLGPCFDTATKGLQGLGMTLVADAARRAADAGLPCFAIGGVDAVRAAELKAAGLGQVAVSSAVCSAADPGAAVVLLRDAISGRRPG